MNDFYSIKVLLVDLAGKLFTYTPKKLTNDIDLEGKFMFVNHEIHGAASLTPQQQVELDSLNYNRDGQGRDYFNSFLTIAIQCGVYLGFQQKQKEIDEVKRSLANSERIIKLYDDEVRELKLNQMGDSDPEKEIIELRLQIRELNEKIREQAVYERVVKTMVTSLNFDKKRV
jgi:hypothetical protein